ncbi:MAG: PKD domain-containing protein [Fulvivirga sp.]
MKTYIKNNLWLMALLLSLVIIGGCSDDDNELGPAPTADFTIAESSILKQGEEVMFTASSSNAFSFKWSFGDGNVAVGKAVTHVYSGPGTFTVTLEASGNGQRDIATQEVVIEGLIPETAFSVENSDDLRVSTTVQFINETVNGLSFVWDFGDVNNSTSTEENPTFIYTEAGDYDVTLTATGTGGESSSTVTITINPNDFELYFINNTDLKVQKINLNDPETVVDVFDLPGFSFGLAYDPEFDELYFSDDDVFKVFRNSINGGNQVEITDGLNGPRDIALDIANNRLFVTERSSDQITEVDISTGTKNTVYSVADDSFFLLPVGLDLYDGNLFATAVDFDAETVWTGSVDGSGISKIIDYGSGGFGYGLEIDKVNEKIYFDDNDGGNILRADLDGTNIESVGSPSDRVYGIAINNETGKFYFASRDGIIKEANLDGTDEKVLVDTTVDIRGLIIRKSN